ncbi:hypothetical protein BGZ51_000664 [Haplosporangium sp. Z 767]|nr:hypothetical protein BGZ51_000664 [Haplosporangium sp. Z 767]KAF9190370.1 hypothetical protein BGZ50_000258 [Haplosporangium sp. Z 11]
MATTVSNTFTSTVLTTLTATATIASTTVSLIAPATNATLDGSNIPLASASATVAPEDAHTYSDSTKVIGLSLAIGSGVLIGASFVFKKKGLINCTKHGMEAGEGHAYLKSLLWWTGMLMMVAGEICNFVAYAFVQPILVTPLGALSVVICAILSSIFLHERLNLQGKVGCTLCIVGATIIVLHAPEQTSVKTIEEFRHLMIQPAFLAWMILIILASLALILKAGPKWGKQHMMVYIGVCSLIGSLSVVSTQALGAAIVHNISTGEPQFNNWFTYFVMVFMVITLLTEINYLNKALNLFNTAMVTPTYYVTFTSTTIITAAILYQGFNASVIAILTVCLGFLVICGGVLLLQTSKPVVPLHIPGSSTSGIISTITLDDIEPDATAMRASPFSSIRRITRDLRQPSIVGETSAVFQSSPLNPRAESLLQRKRRLSNAAQRSRPQSIMGGHSHLSIPTNGMIGTIAGGATAFYPSTTGQYSTMVMGPNGSQIRVQLCEIVVSDEKNETSRYQVYRPVPLHSDQAISTSTAYNNNYRHSYLAPRASFMTDSRSSSVRFSDNVVRPSLDENEKQDEQYQSPPKSPVQKPHSPISGSMFLPPKLSISPPTPSPSSTITPTPVQDASSSPTTLVATSPKPVVTGGSFFARPRFRSASTSTAASGDIMEMNDPNHAGRTVVSIEPVQQQPLYSLYVPPQQHAMSTPRHSSPLGAVHTPLSATVTVNPAASDLSHEKGASQATTLDTDYKNNKNSDTTGDLESGDGPRSSTPQKQKRGIFEKLFTRGQRKDEQDRPEALLTSTTTSMTTTSTSTEEYTPPSPQLPSPASPPPILFNRTNHPTRISEGEEEEDIEELKTRND